MKCPQCSIHIGVFQSATIHPFKTFECPFCDAVLRLDWFTRFLCMITLGIVLLSFCFTFPVMDELIDAQTGRVMPHIVDYILPYIVIPLQVVVLFIPVALYAWLCGRLRIVKKG